jgi:hypothetical protein
LGQKEKMEEDLNLDKATVKPNNLGSFDKQICLRCAKVDAVEDDIYCEQCLKDVERIWEIIKKRNEDKEPLKLKSYKDIFSEETK